MPSCKFFLEGICVKENCPYRHVKVNPEASICPDYLKGYCPNGSTCKMRHVSRCPQFEQLGQCAKGKNCPFPHRKKSVDAPGRKMPPQKPARKSIAKIKEAKEIPDNESGKPSPKKAKTARYFDQKSENDGENASDSTTKMEEGEDAEFQAKRKRLLRKVELAKQGWTGIALVEDPKEEAEADLDDSGPYEEIDEDPEPERPPIGELPSFIPLESNNPSEESPIENKDEEEFEERLI